MAREDRKWTLLELAEETGIPARTVRFYISRGLLAGPAGAGRGAAYTREHLERLQRIHALQKRGMMLSEISLALNGEGEVKLPQPSAWWQYPVAGDVVVWVRAEMSPWRLKQVRKALEHMTAQLDESREKDNTDGRS
jgi:DNA-binding transcriptional MerR regulator